MAAERVVPEEAQADKAAAQVARVGPEAERAAAQAELVAQAVRAVEAVAPEADSPA